MLAHIASELIDVSGLDDSITDKILASEESLEEYPMPAISPTDGTPLIWQSWKTIKSSFASAYL